MGAWNVRALNKTNKQLEVGKFLFSHNISLVGLLETKIKQKGLGALYLRIISNWCIITNLAWHDGGRIIVGWKSEDIKVDVLHCSSQYIHIVGSPNKGAVFPPLCMVHLRK